MQLVWGPEFRIALIGVLCVWVEDPAGHHFPCLVPLEKGPRDLSLGKW